jgi:N-methylhydantoinase A/oxoprolinase/acetone carboxylase beta subunit
MRKLSRLTIDEHREVADILARTRATLVNADVLSRFKRYREQVVDEAATRYFSCRLPCPHTTVDLFAPRRAPRWSQ